MKRMCTSVEKQFTSKILMEPYILIHGDVGLEPEDFFLRVTFREV